MTCTAACFLVFFCRSFCLVFFRLKSLAIFVHATLFFLSARFIFCFSLLFSNPSPKNERGFQKQGTIFLSKKGGLKKTESRFIRNPGLGFKIPREVRIYSTIIISKKSHNYKLSRGIKRSRIRNLKVMPNLPNPCSVCVSFLPTCVCYLKISTHIITTLIIHAFIVGSSLRLVYFSF